MDIYLDLFFKFLHDNSQTLLEPQIHKLLDFLQNEPIPSNTPNFSIDLFLTNIQNNDFAKNPEHSLIFLMLFSDFAQKNALILSDKQKLEVFIQISLKLKVFTIFFLIKPLKNRAKSLKSLVSLRISSGFRFITH